jgi:hypothetical protein
MARHPATIARVLIPLALSACGGGGKPAQAPKPTPTAEVKQPPPPAETEEDRERKRHADAVALIPETSTCLPADLRKVNALHLELAAIGNNAVVCAIDQDRTRLLGPVACWNVEVKDGAKLGALTYQAPTPLPGRGFSAIIDDHCVRGYCLPKTAKVPTDPVALITWDLNNDKVAVLAGDTVHIFNAKTKAHESAFSIRGDKGVASEPVALQWNGAAIFVEASDGTTTPVYMFKPDGTPAGALEVLGGGAKAVASTRNGSFLLLDPNRVAISEQGMTSLTIYEIDSGKRSKLVRKIPPATCKKEELDAVWHDPAAAVTAKCKDFVAKNYAHLIGADVVAGSKNFLALLRGPRLGELVVIDAKNLAERRAIKMPWCDSSGGTTGGLAEGASSLAPTSAQAAKPAPKAAKKAKASSNEAADDPDAGGE